MASVASFKKEGLDRIHKQSQIPVGTRHADFALQHVRSLLSFVIICAGIYSIFHYLNRVERGGDTVFSTHWCSTSIHLVTIF